MKQFLLNFKAAYVYNFLAGILVSAAINIFTTPLTSGTPTYTYRACIIALCFLISSICAFVVGILLEIARGEWESDGCPQDLVIIRQDYIERGKRVKLMWASLLGLILPLICILLVISFDNLIFKGK